MTVPTFTAKVAALHENYSHLRYVMQARLMFSTIHAAAMAFLFGNLEVSSTKIMFGYLLTVVGIIYIIRESNAVDNYMDKILALKRNLNLTNFLAVHLDRELPQNFLWRYVFRVRTAFVLYYSSMFAIVTDFLLVKLRADVMTRILVAFLIVLSIGTGMWFASQTYKRRSGN